MATVGIGLPVYQGENYVEEAIRSVQGQTFDDLELVVCDNASTDRTGEIVQDLAASDPRIRYLRHERNLGAPANYNRAWAESRGRFFKWLAHDDRLRPGYLAAMVKALEATPGAVLCNSTVEYIDSAGWPIGRYDSELRRADTDDPSRRLAAVILRSHSCVDFFGLIRREAMESSLLHGSFHGADRAFLAQMALRGRLIQVEEPLVQMREHAGRYTRQKRSAKDRLAWHGAARAKGRGLPTLILYNEYRKLVRSEALSDAERRACERVLRAWWFRNWNTARLVVDVLAVPFPGVVGVAEQLKSRLFGAAPGHFAHR